MPPLIKWKLVKLHCEAAMKRLMQLILGAFFLLTSSTTFASGVYASFRDSEVEGQSVPKNGSLTYRTTDINKGGGITHTLNGAALSGDTFTINIAGDYKINATVNTMDLNAPSAGANLPQYSFDLRVNGIEQDRITTNMSSETILPLTVGDVINVQYVGQSPNPLNLIGSLITGITETNTATITFIKLDGTPAGVSTCPGGLH